MNLLSISFPKLGWEFDISREVFTIGNFSVYWYGVLIALGFILALVYGLKSARMFGLHPDRVVDVVIVGLIGGIIGARAYYVAFSWEDFADNWVSVFYIHEGGLAIYGGVIGAIGAAAIFCKIKKIRLRPLLDLAAVGFPIGQCIGRWGNFINQEAFGSETDLPWGMVLSDAAYLNVEGVAAGTPVHPCFFYESVWCALGVLLLILYRKHRKFDGELFLMYIGWYGLGRAVIEGFRTDSLWLGDIRVSQLLAALCVVAAVIVIAFIRINIRNMNDPEYMKLYALTEESQIALGLIPDPNAAEAAEEPAADAEDAAEVIPEENEEETVSEEPAEEIPAEEEKTEE